MTAPDDAAPAGGPAGAQAGAPAGAPSGSAGPEGGWGRPGERRGDRFEPSYPPAGQGHGDGEHGDGEHGITVTDRRRIDPQTGEVRHSPEGPGGAAPGPAAAPVGGAGPGAAAPGPGAGVSGTDAAADAVAELTDDLRRVTAEYANYRKRVERDREAVREQAVAAVLAALLPLLDDVDRARGHGELTGGLKSLADALAAVVARFGLEAYGAEGDPFDPTVHEALTHEQREDVAGPTVARVFQPGYRHAGRVVRPARVGVADTA